MKKYEITDIAHPDNPKLHRIRAVTDLTEDVLAGMLGGYVESYDNLDQEGRAWISADAIACENAVVCGDAVLTDHAVAKGCAYVIKGLCRKEILFAIDHFNQIVRHELLRMISWKVGIETGFKLCR